MAEKQKKCRSKIGGQAVLEGVMMRGERSMATAVRDETGRIQLETKRVVPRSEKKLIFRLPFFRGAISFFTSMVTGIKTLLRSAAVFDTDEAEPSKFEKWFAKKFKTNVMNVMIGIALLLGVALAVALFIVLPRVFSGLIFAHSADALKNLWISLTDGGFRLLIFILYIAGVSLMKDIRRVFMYHGAEHKTISCFERGLPLTVENARKQTTVHDRCGTSFMFFVMTISILLFTVVDTLFFHFVPVDNGVLKTVISIAFRIALIPVVSGISYEFLMLLARFDNLFVKILKAPGLLMQKLTTREPQDDMLEVALAAFTKVMEMDADETVPLTEFDTKENYNKFREEIERKVGAVDADWITCEVTGLKRSELAELHSLRKSQTVKALEMADKRAEGIPLQHILGYTDFYGFNIEVNGDVLIPRPETEYLAEEVIKIIGGRGLSVLDLGTGSGCIAIAVKGKCPAAKVTASDVSAKALETAKRNAEKNGVEIEFVSSDLFAGISGKFDIIVSNPPYIKTGELSGLQSEVRDHDPRSALDGGADGLDFYREITAEAPARLNENGHILFESGIGQTQDICNLLAAEFTDIRVIKDLEGVDRIVSAVLK